VAECRGATHVGSKALEEVNRRLKKLVADLALEGPRSGAKWCLAERRSCGLAGISRSGAHYRSRHSAVEELLAHKI
jgi:hypothetical protein